MAIRALGSKEINAVAGGLTAPAVNTAAIAAPGAAPLSGPMLYAPSFVLHVMQRGGRNFWARSTPAPAPVVASPII